MQQFHGGGSTCVEKPFMYPPWTSQTIHGRGSRSRTSLAGGNPAARLETPMKLSATIHRGVASVELVPMRRRQNPLVQQRDDSFNAAGTRPFAALPYA